MSFFGDIGSTLVRGAADVMTFGTNELAGNPAGKLYSSIVDPSTSDPNASLNAANAQNASYNQAQLALAQKNMDLEKEFAQNGITWRVQDAARNGISPLAALGASEPSYSPVMSVMTPMQGAAPDYGVRDAGLNLAVGAGQDVIRSLMATKSPAERTATALSLARASKENDLLDVQIANAKLQLMKSSSPGLPLAYQSMINTDGSVSVVPSAEAAQAAHGQLFGSTAWNLNNALIPEMKSLYNEGASWVTPVKGSHFGLYVKDQN